MKRARVLSYAKLLLIPVALAGAFVFWRSRAHEPARALVERGLVRREAMGTGTVESDERVAVAFTAPGRITSLNVDEGDRVSAGQLLATLDVEEAERQVVVARASESHASLSIERGHADVSRAEVALDAAAKELARTSALVASGAVSVAALDAAVEHHGRAEAELRVAAALLKQASAGTEVARAARRREARRVDDGRVVSPFDGVVLSRLHAVGDVVSPGTTVLVIASTEKVLVRAWIDETALPSLREDGEAAVFVRSEPSRSLRGRVDRIGLEADRQTHEVLVDVELLERPTRLAFGQRADVALLLERRDSVVRAPRPFCDVGAGTCLIERDARVERAAISVGLVGDEWLEVTGGLSPGDVLLAPKDPAGRLEVGSRVRGAGGS